MDEMNKKKILRILEQDAKLCAKDIAGMLALTEEEVAAQIKAFEDSHVINGYHAVVNWEKTDDGDDKVTAIIELQVTPERGNGFDKIAERIYQYPEVQTLLLMSGGRDFNVILHKATMKEVSHFVASKLAVIEGVRSTATHFVLVPYKYNDVIISEEEKIKRVMVTL